MYIAHQYEVCLPSFIEIESELRDLFDLQQTDTRLHGQTDRFQTDL